MHSHSIALDNRSNLITFCTAAIVKAMKSHAYTNTFQPTQEVRSTFEDVYSTGS